MLNCEAGLREVKEATADCNNIAQAVPKNSLFPSHFLFVLFVKFLLHPVTNYTNIHKHP
jgi:hypothetical protein